MSVTRIVTVFVNASCAAGACQLKTPVAGSSVEPARLAEVMLNVKFCPASASEAEFVKTNAAPVLTNWFEIAASSGRTLTVKTAFELVTEPMTLLTITE